MQTSIAAVKKTYEAFASEDIWINQSFYDIRTECLKLVNSCLVKHPGDLILKALKAEIYLDLIKDKAQSLAQQVIKETVSDNSDEARIAKGIAFYVKGILSNESRKFIDTGATLKYYRLSLDNYPSHWNCAAMFSDIAAEEDDTMPEIIRRFDLAIAGNNDARIKNGLASAAAHRCFLREDDQNAIRYLELCKSLDLLTWGQAGDLAVCYARTEQMEKSIQYFKLSADLEQKEYPSNKRIRQVNHPAIWKLAEESIKSYKEKPSTENLILMAMCFEFLPAAGNIFVTDWISERLFADKPDKILIDKITWQTIKKINKRLREEKAFDIIPLKNPFSEILRSG